MQLTRRYHNFEDGASNVSVVVEYSDQDTEDILQSSNICDYLSSRRISEEDLEVKKADSFFRVI